MKRKMKDWKDMVTEENATRGAKAIVSLGLANIAFGLIGLMVPKPVGFLAKAVTYVAAGAASAFIGDKVVDWAFEKFSVRVSLA